MENRTESGGLTNVEQQIEQSRSHWSELAKPESNSNYVADNVADNVEVFKTLQMHPTWSSFFLTFGEGEGRSLVVGEKFAEGGQAELYHAQVKWRNRKLNEYDLTRGREWVLKVFKKGTLLRHLQSQWPHGFLQFHAEEVERLKLGRPPQIRYYCHVQSGTLLKDGRFAFLMTREDEDLRSLIDRNMTLRTRQDRGPFAKEDAYKIMYKVAEGMRWMHSRSIVHRDLKASNVLVKAHHGFLNCLVADFECSVGVIGTGFFRAPEILQACKDRNRKTRETRGIYQNGRCL